MSRSGYSDDLDNWPMIKWRGMVASAIRGKRGQQFLKDLLAALDAMPEKRLIRDYLEKDGQVCAIGCLGRQRGIDMSEINYEEPSEVANTFNIATCLAAEVEFENDQDFSYCKESPEETWTRMRAWVAENIK